MRLDWLNASITRNFSNLEERKKWKFDLPQSGPVKYSGVKCHVYLDSLFQQLRLINSYGTLVKTPQKCVHITEQELSIIKDYSNSAL